MTESSSGQGLQVSDGNSFRDHLTPEQNKNKQESAKQKWHQRSLQGW